MGEGRAVVLLRRSWKWGALCRLHGLGVGPASRWRIPLLGVLLLGGAPEPPAGMKTAAPPSGCHED